MPPSAIPATPGSGPNAPHANAEEENPEDFFGDDPAEAAEPSLMPDDEPTPELEPGAAAEPEPEPEPSKQAPKPSSGEALPGQQLSEDGVSQAEVGAGGEKIVPDPDPDPTSAPSGGESIAPSAGAEQTTPIAEREKALAAAAGGGAAQPADTAVKNGPRGYVVIREVALTREYLDHFSKQLEDGKEPYTIYMVLEPKVEARNPAPVLTGTFKKHRKRLGEPLRLAAIPLTMWKIRSVSLKPKVIDDNIAIED